MKAILGLVNGFGGIRNTRERGGKSPVVVEHAKRGGLRGIRRVLIGSKGWYNCAQNQQTSSSNTL